MMNDRKAAFLILELAHQGRFEWIVGQMIASAIVSGDLDRKEVADMYAGIADTTQHLLYNEGEILPDLLPGGGGGDPMPFSIAETTEVLPEPEDPFKYMVSTWGRRPDGGFQLINDAAARYADSPLYFAEEIEELIMQNVRNSGPSTGTPEWTRHDIFAWITHSSTGKQYTMTWAQARQINILKELSTYGNFVEDAEQAISDAMSDAGEDWAHSPSSKSLRAWTGDDS